jgi:hypothetical protein
MGGLWNGVHPPIMPVMGGFFELLDIEARAEVIVRIPSIH